MHNAEAYLRECLHSIVAQTLTDLEIILVDDGSTDDTAAIAGEYAAADDRITVIPGPAQGSAGAARNAGIEVATGDYLSFLDADDVFAPTLLAELHQRAVLHEADIVLTKFRIHDERTGEIRPVDWPLRLEHFPRELPFAPEAVGDHLFLAVNPAAWNKLFRAEFIRGLGLRFQTLRSANDVFFSYMSLAHATRISYWNAYPVTYRYGNAGSLQGSKHGRPLEFVEALRAMRAHLEGAGLYQRLERAFVNVTLDICLANLRGAATSDALEVLHPALINEVFPEFGILGRPDGYFVRQDLVSQLAELLASTPTQYLYGRWQLALEASRNAQAEAREVLRHADMRSRALEIGEPAPAEQPGRAPAGPQNPGAVDVSVIIPIHNTESYVEECVRSVLRQSRVSVEVICVDDGSTDSSGEILAGLASEDQRVRLLSQENAGPSVARNAGIEIAAGRYVCFLDSDDYWQMDELASLVTDADENELDVLGFDGSAVRHPTVDDRSWARFDRYYERPDRYGDVVTGPEQLARMVKAKDYRSSACFFLVRREVIERARIRFYPGISYEDNLFTFDVMLESGRARHVPTRLYARRVRPGSRMTAGSRTAAAHGYFVNYVEMLRLVHGREYPPAVSTEIGRIIFSMYRHGRAHFVKLAPDVTDSFRLIDPKPDAQTLFHLLKRAHREAQLGRPAGAPARPATVRSRARRFLGRGKRAILRLFAR
jgi:glycosyltransferase involved in cell wall biosynthesis